MTDSHKEAEFGTSSDGLWTSPSLSDEERFEHETRPYQAGMSPEEWSARDEDEVETPRTVAPVSEPPVPLPLDLPSEEPTNPFAPVPAGLGSSARNELGSRPRSPQPDRLGDSAPEASAPNPFLAGDRVPQSSAQGDVPTGSAPRHPAPPRRQPVAPQPAGGAPGASSGQGGGPGSAPGSASLPGSAPLPGVPGSQRQGAPLVAQPGAVSPDIGDAYAAFRRGSVLRPVALSALALAAVAALIYLLPGEEKPTRSAAQKTSAEESAVIGRSLPPYRTTLEEESSEDHRAAFRRTEERAREKDADSDASRPSGVPTEGEFKDAFKKAAK